MSVQQPPAKLPTGCPKHLLDLTKNHVFGIQLAHYPLCAKPFERVGVVNVAEHAAARGGDSPGIRIELLQPLNHLAAPVNERDQVRRV